ncbi:hypothetical protein J6590_041151 [Homalodisca vitripennis]|nr:hypothetical protein J6590_041151 [Homalodisca vitripennis]
MNTEYCISRISNRRLFTVFCSLLNIRAKKCHIILKSNTNILVSRRNYLTELARALAIPHMTRRPSLPNLSLSLCQKLKSIVGTPPPEAGPKIQCAHFPTRKKKTGIHKLGVVVAIIMQFAKNLCIYSADMLLKHFS